MVQPKTRNRIVDALMALAAERPWDAVTLEALAERAGVTLPALRAAYDGRLAVLADFVRRTDERVLSGVDPDMAGEAPRERLFDVLFSRFEALAPHKQAIRNLAVAARRDLPLALEINRIVTGSMAWMLAAAGIPATGTRGLIRAQGLACVWSRVARVWLDDGDPGLARTMAELDKRLRQAERSALRLDRLARIVRGRRRARPQPPPKAADEGDIAEGHPS
jgi:AcrR family transcriptional regulator